MANNKGESRIKLTETAKAKKIIDRICEMQRKANQMLPLEDLFL